MKGSGDGSLRARQQGPWQDKFYNVDVLRVVFCSGYGAIHFKFQAVNIASLSCVRKIEFCIAVFQKLVAESRSVIFISVRPQMEPYETKRIGRIIVVSDLFKSVEGLFLIIQGYVDDVVRPLLPILSESRKPHGAGRKKDG